MPMRIYIIAIMAILTLLSCKQQVDSGQTENPTTETLYQAANYDFTMVFASCADQKRPQPLWEPVLEVNSDLFVWGGDNIYADTEDMAKMKSDYDKVWALSGYAELAAKTTITGTWDDHDYGKNDAGVEYSKKKEAQKLLLDFLKVPEDDIRRSREGVYTSEIYETPEGKIKLILLDTRYFRDALKRSDVPGRRYEAWEDGHEGTVLGEDQWKWLEEELNNSDADFNLVVSSI